MIPEKVKKILKKQHYEIVGKHSAVQTCRWTKRSLRNEGVCYKEQFYGIKSHLCCQMTPSVMWCPNQCLHCWRAVEHTIGDKLDKEKVDSASEIIDGCIEAQRKLLQGFKILPETADITFSKVDMKKWEEAQEPMQFAISLSGEPTIYPYVGELIEELKQRGKTSFLVTNGLYPEKLQELKDKNQLPTQLYLSVNAPNKKLYDEFHRSSKTDAWELLNKSLEVMSTLTPQGCTLKNIPKNISTKGNSRTVFRMNLVRDLNMGDELIKEYSEMIRKAKPMFVEIKGFMSVGFARERLGYDRMPTNEEMENFIAKLVAELGEGYKLLDSHERSRAYVLGKDESQLKIEKP